MAQNEICPKSKMDGEERLQCRNISMTAFPPTPLGLEALYSLCRRIYPDQMNPLQVTALVKYW
jgi:suppressor of fused-like protein